MKHRAEFTDLRRDDEDAVGVLGDQELGVRAVDDARALTGAGREHRGEARGEATGRRARRRRGAMRYNKGDSHAATTAVITPDTKFTALLLRNSEPLMRVTVGPGLLTTF